jgi:hypothetical protein
MSTSLLVLVVWSLLVFAENAFATAVGIRERWPAAFGVIPDPDHITLLSGSAIAAPLVPLLVLVGCIVLLLLPWRWLRRAGAVGAALLGVLILIGTLGEPTTFQPESGLEEAFHLTGLVLAIGLVGLGVWAAAVDSRPLRIISHVGEHR